MALRHQAESPKRALPGHILLVVHNFEARSPDELSLIKGDRIELIERDDDFGDGWYLGRHIINGKTGLFPEVYTTSAPKGTATTLAAISASNTELPVPVLMTEPSNIHDSHHDNAVSTASTTPGTPATPVPENGLSQPQNSTPATPPSQSTASNMPPPEAAEAPDDTAPAPSLPNNISRTLSIASAGIQRAHGEDSPVMNETLSVIEEHITDMNTPRHSLAAADRRATNDSGSDYSTQLDQRLSRLSYITGHETDEEEESLHSAAEIMQWGPTRVAEYLSDAGVEQRHCEVFAEQEITGEVLLGMDQSSILIKDLDLGPVGRRLRTWHKIKSLQDEVRGTGDGKRTSVNPPSRSPTLDSSNRTRTSTNSTVLPRIPSLMERNNPQQQNRIERHRSQQSQPTRTSMSTTMGSIGTHGHQNSPTRPSAASIRDFNHARRHSSIDYGGSLTAERPVLENGASSPSRTPGTPHRKQHSFDRNWTMGNSTSLDGSTPSPGDTRDVYSNHPPPTSSSQTPRINDFSEAFNDLDRGYFSGGELENRKSRNVLKKRDGSAILRGSSYTEQQRERSATAHSRHSRFVSADSVQSNLAMSGALSTTDNGHGYRDRSLKAYTRLSQMPGQMPLKTGENSTVVTRLEYDRSSSVASGNPASSDRSTTLVGSLPNSPNLSSPKIGSRFSGLRAISDAVIGGDRSSNRANTESVMSPVRESRIRSATQQGARSPSLANSKDSEDQTSDSPKVSPGISALMATTGTVRRKTKKHTSAYIRGLEKKSPQEQIVGSDYSGWMKKKSSNLMTTWKPRLFVLRGRRLSYYYGENDDQEKGLIDISSHRVLPADNDRITGLHATLTGAGSSPTSPQDAQMPTSASVDAAAAELEPRSTLHNHDAANPGDTMFIFKLVPPRLGLSKAVNFTRPTVHYFAVDNIKQGRLWMAALMKATIDRDETAGFLTTNQQKTISLQKARQLRHRPPALMMGLDEVLHAGSPKDSPTSGSSEKTNLNATRHSSDPEEDDSGISGLDSQSKKSSEQQSQQPLSASTKRTGSLRTEGSKVSSVTTVDDGTEPGIGSGSGSGAGIASGTGSRDSSRKSGTSSEQVVLNSAEGSLTDLVSR